jgi:hypothetical protein
MPGLDSSMSNASHQKETLCTRELERVAPGVEHDGDGLRRGTDGNVAVPSEQA